MAGKRKATDGAADKKKKSKTIKNKENDGETPLCEDYKAFSLDDIKGGIAKLCQRVPTVPADGIDPEDKEAVREWSHSMQAAIEEFSLLMGCVSAATYRWGTDRSGAADQSLTLLSSELATAQEQISTACSTRLTNVLAPVVDLVVEKVVTSKDEKSGEEIKTNHYTRERVDPSFVNLCGRILCRNAVMLRQVVLANFHKAVKVIVDFEKALKKDNQNDRQNFAY